MSLGFPCGFDAEDGVDGEFFYGMFGDGVVGGILS